MVRKPERRDGVVFAGTEYRTVPGPTLFVGVSMVIQLLVLTTVHEHNVGDVSVTCPVAARKPCERLVGARV